MRLLVKYVDFHPDNYQGGSGKSFEFETVIEIKEPCDDVWDSIHFKLAQIVTKQRPFNTKNQSDFPVIQKVILI